MKEERPWGNFEQFTHNEISTVKIITLKPNSKVSYQYHNQRDEFWRIISGEGVIIIDDKEYPAKPGDEFNIPKLAKHRVITKDSSIQFLEISKGNFDEQDIVRLEDDYNRI